MLVVLFDAVVAKQRDHNPVVLVVAISLQCILPVALGRTEENILSIMFECRRKVEQEGSAPELLEVRLKGALCLFGYLYLCTESELSLADTKQ